MPALAHLHGGMDVNLGLLDQREAQPIFERRAPAEERSRRSSAVDSVRQRSPWAKGRRARPARRRAAGHSHPCPRRSARVSFTAGRGCPSRRGDGLYETGQLTQLGFVFTPSTHPPTRTASSWLPSTGDQVTVDPEEGRRLLRWRALPRAQRPPCALFE